MERFGVLTKDKVSKLPKSPGVYCFKKDREFLYIGKAVNIKERVKNHFHPVKYREAVILPKAKLFNRVKQIGYIKTDSEIEALLLEANLIKKYQPKYNVIWRDDKNFFYIGITKENFPRIFLTHQPTIVSRIAYLVSGKRKKTQNTKYEIPNTRYIGPFVEGRTIKQTLRFLRRIFPYYTLKKHPQGPCPYCHLELCPGPTPDIKEYKKNIANLINVLKGKRKSVLKNLKKEMKLASSKQEFEKAAKIRDQIKALENVLSHTKFIEEPETPKVIHGWQNTQRILQNLLKTKKKILRIEAYDVSNIQGQLATGSMVTFINGKPDKNFYRKFKIQISGRPNDIAMTRECLIRRFKHPEWGWPDLILIDGGRAQLNAALQILKKYQRKSAEKAAEGGRPNQRKISVLALAKKKNELFIEGQKGSILLKSLPREIFNLILQLRDEAHRFAITYHRKLRKKELIAPE